MSRVTALPEKQAVLASSSHTLYIATELHHSSSPASKSTRIPFEASCIQVLMASCRPNDAFEINPALALTATDVDTLGLRRPAGDPPVAAGQPNNGANNGGNGQAAGAAQGNARGRAPGHNRS